MIAPRRVPDVSGTVYAIKCVLVSHTANGESGFRV